jgi:hypothetical protein
MGSFVNYVKFILFQSSNVGMKGSHLVLTCQSINTLQDLYGFFSTLCIRWPNSHHFTNINPDKDVKSILAEIEQVLSFDFLERMPNASRWKLTQFNVVNFLFKAQLDDTMQSILVNNNNNQTNPCFVW